MINGSLGVFAWFHRKSWIYMGELRRPQRLRHRHSTEMCRAGENSSKEVWFFRWFPAHQEISSSCVSPPQFGQHFRGRFDLGWLLLILGDSHRSFQKYLPHRRRQFVPNADCPSACWSFIGESWYVGQSPKKSGVLLSRWFGWDTFLPHSNLKCQSRVLCLQVYHSVQMDSQW